MRLTALVLLLQLATPFAAQAEADPELMPSVSHDLALTCLALWASEVEASPDNGVADKVKEMVFFSRLIAEKATAEEAARFDVLFAEQLDFYRMTQAALGNPATRDEADMELTGSGKMCWFQILQEEGGPYEGN